ncbi:hypothetical protein D3C83_301640 [compost metagenome]
MAARAAMAPGQIAYRVATRYHPLSVGRGTAFRGIDARVGIVEPYGFQELHAGNGNMTDAVL